VAAGIDTSSASIRAMTSPRARARPAVSARGIPTPPGGPPSAKPSAIATSSSTARSWSTVSIAARTVTHAFRYGRSTLTTASRGSTIAARATSVDSGQFRA
jgi:hypothetical protein